MSLELLSPPMPAAEFWTCDRRILANVDWFWSRPINGVEYVTGVRWKDESAASQTPDGGNLTGGV